MSWPFLLNLQSSTQVAYCRTRKPPGRLSSARVATLAVVTSSFSGCEAANANSEPVFTFWTTVTASSWRCFINSRAGTFAAIQTASRSSAAEHGEAEINLFALLDGAEVVSFAAESPTSLERSAQASAQSPITGRTIRIIQCFRNWSIDEKRARSARRRKARGVSPGIRCQKMAEPAERATDRMD